MQEQLNDHLRPYLNNQDLKSNIELLGINQGSYRIFKQKVVFEEYDIDSSSKKRDAKDLEGVDLKTFEVYKSNFINFYILSLTSLQRFHSNFTDYAKDKNHVFYKGGMIENVEPNNFVLIDYLHAKTAKNVYYKNEIIWNADIETFQSLNDGYAKDKNNYYREGKIVQRDENIKRLEKKIL